MTWVGLKTAIAKACYNNSYSKALVNKKTSTVQDNTTLILVGNEPLNFLTKKAPGTSHKGKPWIEKGNLLINFEGEMRLTTFYTRHQHTYKNFANHKASKGPGTTAYNLEQQLCILVLMPVNENRKKVSGFQSAPGLMFCEWLRYPAPHSFTFLHRQVMF